MVFCFSNFDLLQLKKISEFRTKKASKKIKDEIKMKSNHI